MPHCEAGSEIKLRWMLGQKASVKACEKKRMLTRNPLTNKAGVCYKRIIGALCRLTAREKRGWPL